VELVAVARVATWPRSVGRRTTIMSNNSSSSNAPANYGTTISIESLKVIAEIIGIPSLSDECGKELSEDITFKLKHIIQVSSSKLQIELFILMYLFRSFLSCRMP